MMKTAGFSVLALAAAASIALAGDQTFEDFFGSYFHRTDTIAVGAGDAKDVNGVSEMLDPWPRKVKDRNLPADGARMTGAIQRYQDVRRIKEGAPPLSPEAISAVGMSGGGAK